MRVIPALIAAAAGLAFVLVSASAADAATKRKRLNRSLPTWEQCFPLSVDRGANHDYDEWQLFLAECMAGKIPLR